MAVETGRIGSSFAEFLDEQGIQDEVEGLAVKELIAEQISAAMKAEGLTKVVMARRMRTTRAQLDRLLDPANPSVTLTTQQRAAKGRGSAVDHSPDLKSQLGALAALNCERPVSRASCLIDIAP